MKIGVWKIALLAACLAGCQGDIGAGESSRAVCLALGPGESAVVDHRETSLPARYTLRRETESDYTTYLNLRFEPRNAATDAAAARYLQGATAACLDGARAGLRGPGGLTLTVRLIEEAREGVPLPPEVTISVTSLPTERGHSKLWRADWACPEIVHETFHLLGLVDEYTETDLAAFPYDCRASGPATSLMAAPLSAYSELAAGSRDSLLFPAEFRAIVKPGCGDVNGTFYRCARNSYRTSLDRNGPGCLDVPVECRDGRTDWIER